MMLTFCTYAAPSLKEGQKLLDGRHQTLKQNRDFYSMITDASSPQWLIKIAVTEFQVSDTQANNYIASSIVFEPLHAH